jgi:hypothetical protein
VQLAYIGSPDVLGHLEDLRSSIHWSIADIEIDDERHCTNAADALGCIEREGAALIGDDVNTSSSRSELMIDEQVVREVS